MLESNEDKIKKTTQSKDEVIEPTKENEVISEQVNVELDSKEVVVEDEVTKASGTEKATADSKEPDTQEIGIDEKEAVSSDDNLVSKENSDEVEGNTEEEKPKKEVEIIKYDTLSLEELTDALDNIIHTQKVQHIKSSVEAIKSAFNLKFGTLLAEKKSLFLAEGGNTIDFQYSSPVKSKYNKLLSDYKKQKDIHYSNLEKQLKDNLEKRVQVIEDLKILIENADTKTMYKHFRDLQNTWRSIGPVPKTKYNDTWKIYHHHVERFYDLLHLSNDFRDLDFKNNLEEKLKLIEKAEFLAEMKDVNAAFKELQDLHKTWKEDIGPVAREMRDDVWDKFSAATKIIHDKRHDHFKSMKSQYVVIIEAKMLVIDEILSYDSSKNKTHNDWQKSIKDIDALRKKYFDAGKLPYSKSESIWKKFKEATKQFNREKNKFYKQEKNAQQNNLQAKLDLIKLAESIKDSEDWETTTNTFKKIQSDWKKIGHVPRKFSDDIWNKFKSSCNYYFDRYHNQKNALSDEQKEIIGHKIAFVEALKVDDYTTKDTITNLMESWSQLGSTPRGSKAVDLQFNKFVDGLLSKLSLDKSEIVLLKFKNIINGYLANNDTRKLDSELVFVRKKIDESVREIQQLENNLSFFSNASDDNPMVKNVHKNIDTFKNGLKVWKDKLAYIRSLDY
ncbi:MAG: DUF349 domain-containing protein [Flavobacteriaceae bacterium]|nr:DUF349 domain-containing protein [Flavobacteriaceae bacterium]